MESASPGPGTSRHLRVPGRPVRERLAVILELGEGSDMEGHGLHLLGARCGGSGKGRRHSWSGRSGKHGVRAGPHATSRVTANESCEHSTHKHSR